MKVLLINKFHYLRGGAERCYLDTARLLEEQGHEVAFFSMKDPKNHPSKWQKYFIDRIDYDQTASFVNKVKNAFNLIYNFSAQKKLEQLIRDYKPDVAHLHNIYHQLSPSIIDILKKNNIPIVMTLHDYNLICPNYNLFAHNKIWEKSKPDKYWKCFTDKCFKDSYLKSFLVTIGSYLHHKILKTYDKVDVFISPSRFLINKFREYEFEGEIKYLPNPLLNFQSVKNTSLDGDYILYFGRLSSEKGVADLIKAYVKSGVNIKLKIAGTGLDENILKVLASGNKNIEFLGWKDDKLLNDLIKKSLFVVVPSRWYENAPYSVVETLALGKAVLCPKLGGLKEMIKDRETGFFYKPLDYIDLSNKLKYLVKNKDKLANTGRRAQEVIFRKNNPEAYLRSLIEIYNNLKK